MSNGPVPSATPVPAAPASPSAPAGAHPHDLSLRVLLARCKSLPADRQSEARDALLQLRGWRLLVMGPRGGGKTTAVMELCKRLGRIGMVSLDRDMKPVPGMRLYRMPEPEVVDEITTLQAAHKAAITDMRTTRGSADEFRVYALDSVTTIYNMCDTFMVETDPMMGMGQGGAGQMKSMRSAAAVAKIAMSWAMSIWRLCGRTCEVSQVDGPLVFVVTEHCRPMTRGEANPTYNKDGTQVVDLAFHSWVPMVGKATGNRIEGGPDLVIGYSMGCGEHGPWDLKADWTGAHTKHRFTPQELDIFATIMKGTRSDRLGVALCALYTRRKAVWLKQWCGITVPGFGDKDDTAKRWAPAGWEP